MISAAVVSSLSQDEPRCEQTGKVAIRLKTREASGAEGAIAAVGSVDGVGEPGEVGEPPSVRLSTAASG